MSEIAGFQLVEDIFSSDRTRACRAVRQADGRSVVLKILSGEPIRGEDFLEYRREYDLTAGLDGVAGVIKVYGITEIQDSVMIIEEDIGGYSLARHLEEGRLGLERALQVAADIAGALGRIHDHGVIHKDLTPGNIVWNPASGELRIIDFGIASQLSQERQEFQSVNQIEGSLAYISPEQTGRVNRRLDYRSDLYSLGVTLYHMLTGELPFAERDGIELVHAHIALNPQPPHLRNPGLPPLLSDIVMRLMTKMADDRYQSAHGVEHDLRQCLAQLRETGRIAEFPLARRDVSQRFQIPQKLYGREQEIAAILSTFERSVGGATELLLVSGFSGTGKSALVHEVHRPLTERHGSFVAGKFDQYQRDVPFYAWTRAFEEFCNLLLKENEADLAAWRQKILAAIGASGKVLTELVPSLEAILGPQPDVPELAGEQALNRRNHVFGKFLRAICQSEHPLVVFLDDWQWADAGSLSLLKAVMGDQDIRHLLVIAAYRDNEVTASHPFAMALQELRGNGVEPTQVALAGLSEGDVAQLVADALAGAQDSQLLARLVYEKTQGNAFFLVQLLGDLYRRSVIRYSGAGKQWVWSRQEVETQGIADNVVELMAGKIRQLPAAACNSLVYAACIGDRFDLFTLATVLRQPAHRVAADLEPALREGILVPIGLNYRVAGQEGNTEDVSYQFIHDRVRQAAYGLLGADEAAQIHHDIAILWLDGYDAGEMERHIFDLANQFNSCRRLAAASGRTEVLIDINLRAGKRAKNSTAYSTARQYFEAALGLQGGDAWTLAPARTAELLLLAAEVAFLTTDYVAMESWLEDYLGHVEPPLERILALRIRLQAHVAQNRLVEAVDVGLHALALVGVSLPRCPSGADVGAELTQTIAILEGRSIEELLDLPPMTDANHLAAMDLLGLTLPPAYWTSQELLGLVVFRMVRLSVEHGYSLNAGYGFSWWAILSCALLGQVDTGCAFGEFGIEIAKRRHLNLQQPLFFDAWIVRKYKQALKSTLPVFEETYALALEKGDFEYASYARNNHMQMLFHCGRELAGVLPEMEKAHADLLRFQIGSSLYWHDIWWQAAINFAQPALQPDCFGGPAYDEAVSLPQHLKVNDISSLFLLYCAKLMLSCFFGNRDNALAHADKARGYLPGGVGTHAFVLFHFYDSLAVLANQDRVGKRRAAKRVGENLERLRQAAAHAPMNYGQHVALVEAERLRVANKSDQALRYYDQAIDLARDNGFMHEEALAQEMAGRCHMDRGQSRLATFYLRQALRLYQRWGAAAKVRQIEAEFASLLLTSATLGEAPRGGTTTVRSTSGSQGRRDSFDIEAVTGAARAISSEIVLDKLVTTLLRIVMEHAGAQKALLILQDGAELRVQARGLAEQRIEITVVDTPLDDGDDASLPRSLIRYVGRTLKSQVIHDARLETPFASDPYIRRVKPLSVLCEPIVQQGKLAGMLYLENNLTAGAFTEDRLELLRLLSSQAAIAIDNARLYHGLERKVAERTESLQTSLANQERLNSDLQAASQQLEQAHTRLHEANRLLQQQADTDSLTGLANRRSFNDRLRYELDRCARDRQPLALIMCDLDNFKSYNDTYGHVAGDECLRRTAAAFRSVCVRATDMVARYGGEEFVVLLPLTTAEQAAGLGEAMRTAVAALGIEHLGNGDFGIVTVSAGCHSLVPQVDTDQESVISQADKALYLAKNQGRNRLVRLE